MSTSVNADDEEEVEDEVEFVSEGPMRPVLECIDLSSDSENEGYSADTLDDDIHRQKARVASTLDRLAHQVAVEKQERADKCRAFKEKQVLLKAHRQRELAFTSPSGSNREAKRCVDMWLKMPGIKPGLINTSFGRKHRGAAFPRGTQSNHTCPVLNCDRVFDNASLLDGHLKRFDHSPCDPTIYLNGSPSEFFACVACGEHFQSQEEWRKHLQNEVSSQDAQGHALTQTYQLIVCFACPACYHLFNLRDQCLQHMSAKDHFSDSLVMNELGRRSCPVPIPQYAKNRLIALCKETTFLVKCSICHQILSSHQVARAHFNVYCRQGCAIAEADKTIVQVMKQLQVRGQCCVCCKTFQSFADIRRHEEETQHEVELNQTMEKALLQLCRFSKVQQSPMINDALCKKDISGEFSAKRQKLSANINGNDQNSTTAWFCECGLQFSEEAAATKHLLSVNQILHQCGVCGKHMEELSVTRLHMSRFHGGAHLSNFLYCCRLCKVDMPRYADILSHVSETHSGHTFVLGQEVPADLVEDAKPSTSGKLHVHTHSHSRHQPDAIDVSSSKPQKTWMCRMCEDIFDSEAAVHKHCSDLTSHSFQRFVCGHCPQRFFKESTVRRHCVNEHNGEIKSSYFCGLCDSMHFDVEDEFLSHYHSHHSKDYYCVEDHDNEDDQPTVVDSVTESGPLCSCMSSQKSKEGKRAVYTQCMRNLATEGKCLYFCPPCNVSVSTYPQMKVHIHTTHEALNLGKSFEVLCKGCQESFMGVPSFHKHYHSQHCALEPCVRSRNSGKEVQMESNAFHVLDGVEINEHADEIDDETLVTFLSSNKSNSQQRNKTDAQKVGPDGNGAVLLSKEESQEDTELEEALKRSLLEF